MEVIANSSALAFSREGGGMLSGAQATIKMVELVHRARVEQGQKMAIELLVSMTALPFKSHEVISDVQPYLQTVLQNILAEHYAAFKGKAGNRPGWQMKHLEVSVKGKSSLWFHGSVFVDSCNECRFSKWAECSRIRQDV